VAIETMAVEDAEDLAVAVLDDEKVILVHVVRGTFTTAKFYVLKLLFGITLEMVEDVLFIEDFFRIIEQNFIVPCFLRVSKIVDPSAYQDVFVLFIKFIARHQND
jgi:hypothetical protein